MKLIFIRHCEPDYSIDSLTEKGWREAELLGKRVAKWENVQFFRSPLGRAGDSARPAMRMLGKPMTELETKDWLREFPPRIIDPETGKEKGICWDLMPGDWTKDPKNFDKDSWYRSEIMQTGPVEEACRRVTEGLDTLLEEHGYRREGAFYVPERPNEETLVFFCHLGVMCVMMSHLMNVAATVLWHSFFIPPSSVSIAGTEERRAGEAYFRFQTIGDTKHLAAGNEPISDSGYYTHSFQG